MRDLSTTQNRIVLFAHHRSNDRQAEARARASLTVAGLAAIRMQKALKRYSSTRKCKICGQLEKKHDARKRSCQDCVAANVASVAAKKAGVAAKKASVAAKKSKAGSAKKVKVARGSTVKVDLQASGKSVKVSHAKKTKVPAKESKVGAGLVVQQRQEMNTAPRHAGNHRASRRREPQTPANLWVVTDSRASRAGELETKEPVKTGQEIIDMSEEDDSDYVDEAEQEHEGEEERTEEGCVVHRSARKHVVREHPGVLGRSSDSASEYDQTDEMEEPGSDWNDKPDEEAESDSDCTPQAVRVTRESWGPPSRNYPQ
jgi:hypothetical protein